MNETRRGCNSHHLHHLIFKKKTISPTKPLRVNLQITSDQVRVIDESGAQLGVMNTHAALEIARQKSLDLVEVSPLAQPPVCKIVNWGAYQYQQDRINRKQKTKQKKSEVKGIRISLKIGQHDLEMRVDQTKKFLERGDRVKLEMILRGREMQFKERAKEKMQQFVDLLQGVGEMDGRIASLGNRLSLLIGKKK